MIRILKKIVEILDNKDQNGFTDLESIEKAYDGVINMSHSAENPKRDLRIEFKNEDEAMQYLNRFGSTAGAGGYGGSPGGSYAGKPRS